MTAERIDYARLSPDLVPAAAALLADSFFTNPAHVYLCPDERRRRVQLEWLLGGNLRVQPDLSNSFCVVRAGSLDAMGFWTRSTGPEASLPAKLRAGLVQAPLRIGWGGLGRVLHLTRAIDAALDELLPARPYWYLNNFVVRERLRGTGLGGRMLRDQLAHAAAQEPRWPFALTTQRPENVAFYRRFGFEVAKEQELGQGAARFRNWTMLRDAGAGDEPVAPWADEP